MNQRSTQYVSIALGFLLIVGCIAVLSPFIGTLLLAVVVCITVWPAHARLLQLVGRRRTLAALISSLILILLLLLPMVLLAGTLANGVEMLIQTAKPLIDHGLPSRAPDWIANLPLIGPDLAAYWHKLAVNRTELNKVLQQAFDPTSKWLLKTVGIFVQGLLQLMLVIFFTFFILRDGDQYAHSLRTMARNLAGNLGERMLALTSSTTTGVMVGIVGTAAAQALVGMIGYLIAGVPAILLLSFATFIFSMVPVVGSTLIWGGAAIWLYQQGEPGWAIFMVLWGMLAISSVDNFVKPILISRTASLPLVLIIVGVFGGVLVFGFIGLFLGPVLLALGQALIRDLLLNTPTREQTITLP